MSCQDSENHENHICKMKEDQKVEEVARIKYKASHFCQNCDEPTSDPSRVCNPKEYKGKSGVLKWR